VHLAFGVAHGPCLFDDAAGPGALKWLSTHPLTPDRINHLTSYIEDNRLGGSELGASRHREIKSRLASTAGSS